jgi:predicted transcriptional regulator
MTARTDRPNLTLDQKARIVELHCQFWTQTKIAAEMGVAQSTVSQTIAEYVAIAGTKEALAQAASRMQALHIQKLEHIAHEAMLSWELSKQPKRRMTKKSGTKSTPAKGRKPPAEETSEESSASQEDQTGNPAYLMAAAKALADARAIAGADAPTKSIGAVFGAGPLPGDQALTKRIIANPAANELIHELLLTIDEAG